MKRILIIPLALLLLVMSCSGQNKQEKGKVQHITKAEFLTKVVDYENNSEEWKYLGDKPAIIDFYASWCGPCKIVAPILEELAEEYKDQIVIYKVDTDKEKQLSADFGIRSIPTILFVPQQGDPRVAQGAMPKKDLVQAIEDILLKQ